MRRQACTGFVRSTHQRGGRILAPISQSDRGVFAFAYGACVHPTHIFSYIMRIPMRATLLTNSCCGGRSFRRTYWQPGQRIHATVDARCCADAADAARCQCLRPRWLRAGANQEDTTFQEGQCRRPAYLVARRGVKHRAASINSGRSPARIAALVLRDRRFRQRGVKPAATGDQFVERRLQLAPFRNAQPLRRWHGVDWRHYFRFAPLI